MATGRNDRSAASQASGSRGRRGCSAAAQASGGRGRRGRSVAAQASGGHGRRGRIEGFQASGDGGGRGHNAATQKRDARGRFKPPTPPLTPTSSSAGTYGGTPTSSSAGTYGGTPTSSSSGMYGAVTSSSSSDGPHPLVEPSGKGKHALVGCKRSRSDVRVVNNSVNQVTIIIPDSDDEQPNRKKPSPVPIKKAAGSSQTKKIPLRQEVEQLKDRYDDLREEIENLGLHVDGAHEIVEMILKEFMDNVAAKLDVIEKKIRKVYEKVNRK